MAEPTTFPEANKILARPASMTDEECVSLPVFTDGQTCISRWQPSADDLERLVRGAPIWVWVISGATQPPIAITTESPFQPTACTCPTPTDACRSYCPSRAVLSFCGHKEECHG